jgi:hypothetical protein
MERAVIHDQDMFVPKFALMRCAQPRRRQVALIERRLNTAHSSAASAGIQARLKCDGLSFHGRLASDENVGTGAGHGRYTPMNDIGLKQGVWVVSN